MSSSSVCPLPVHVLACLPSYVSPLSLPSKSLFKYTLSSVCFPHWLLSLFKCIMRHLSSFCLPVACPCVSLSPLSPCHLSISHTGSFRCLNALSVICPVLQSVTCPPNEPVPVPVCVIPVAAAVWSDRPWLYTTQSVRSIIINYRDLY